MATDGTKIIDSDTAHDTYWGIMDLYDNQAPTEMILQEFPLENPEYQYDDFDYEIYVTSCGLAYWEIGLMTAERLAYIEQIVAKNACVTVWAEESKKEASSRKSVLTRFLKKISKENTKLRKPKKYRKVTNFVFQADDVLAFQLANGEYRCVICTKVKQYRGACEYWLVPTDYQSKQKPSFVDIENGMLLGGMIRTARPKEELIAEQAKIEQVWAYLASPESVNDKKNTMSDSDIVVRDFLLEQNPNSEIYSVFGTVVDSISHKDLLLLKSHFEVIGQVRLLEGFKRYKSYGGVSTMEDFEKRFGDIDEECRTFKYLKFPVEILV